VLDLPDLERGDVVRRQPLERALGLRTAELELAHVAHVEAPDRAPDRPVLLHDARVLDRHVPAAEPDHTAAGADVRRVERSALPRGIRRLGHPAPSRRVTCATSAIMASPRRLFNRGAATGAPPARPPPDRTAPARR